MIVILFVCVSAVHAEKLGIAVDEQKIAFDMDAGEEQTVVIKVTNVSDNEQKVRIEPIDYQLGENNAIAFDENADQQNGIREWVQIAEQEITLPAHMGKDVTLVVRVPENASVGSHRGAVLFRAVTESQDETVSVQGQIGVHMLINIKGNTHATGGLRSFDIPLISMGDVAYAANFANTGNIHYIPHGEVFVKNLITKKNYTYDLNDGDHFVFPGKDFTFETIEHIPSLFGIYRAQAVFVDGEGAIRTKDDYVMGGFFPVVVLLLVIGVSVITVMVVKTQRKNMRAKNITQENAKTKKPDNIKK